MSAIWIAALALMASPEAVADSGVNVSRAETSAVTKDCTTPTIPSIAQLRTKMSSRLRAAAELARSDDQAAARQLLKLHDELIADAQLPLSDRTRYLGIVRYRLAGLQKSISRSIAKSEPRSRSITSLASTSTARTSGAKGGAAVRDSGQELVDLIQTTIAPDSWDVNGGPGSIVYYQPLRVLVVRQTDRVHELLGGAVGGLRGQ
jgi:hypothetical protein